MLNWLSTKPKELKFDGVGFISTTLAAQANVPETQGSENIVSLPTIETSAMPSQPLQIEVDGMGIPTNLREAVLRPAEYHPQK
ncbi:hypothetical protein L596_000365 [Steinernema carpocapsae]|uniref:Uncharacterized protein n=1 Tax=Steinernema carpocapsae TaxID=34508 RepID=A0A4U8UM49_STECR|nr:hypothetical protein L596_000365 [Steinernema carpocapsae]